MDNSPFGTLPLEIRLQIYEEYFTKTMIDVTDIAETGGGLLYTCKEVRNEALPELFKHAKFRIDGTIYRQCDLVRGELFAQLTRIFGANRTKHITQVFSVDELKYQGSPRKDGAITVDYLGWLLRQRCAACNKYHEPDATTSSTKLVAYEKTTIMIGDSDCGTRGEKAKDAEKPQKTPGEKTDEAGSRELQLSSVQYHRDLPPCRLARVVAYTKGNIWRVAAVWPTTAGWSPVELFSQGYRENQRPALRILFRKVPCQRTPEEQNAIRRALREEGEEMREEYRPSMEFQMRYGRGI